MHGSAAMESGIELVQKKKRESRVVGRRKLLQQERFDATQIELMDGRKKKKRARFAVSVDGRRREKKSRATAGRERAWE